LGYKNNQKQQPNQERGEKPESTDRKNTHKLSAQEKKKWAVGNTDECEIEKQEAWRIKSH
jgi:hypothetical protein